jgi:hypothetical protein
MEINLINLRCPCLAPIPPPPVPSIMPVLKYFFSWGAQTAKNWPADEGDVIFEYSYATN